MAAEIDRRTLKKEALQTLPVDRELNLKGKICPYTFIESMLTLEEMKPDEVLRVIVDYPPALAGRLLLFNALSLCFDEVKIEPNPVCRLCGERPAITGLIDYPLTCQA
jgi:TusA-related sulfurtransferase